jgi:ZIP family zinc transporter
MTASSKQSKALTITSAVLPVLIMAAMVGIFLTKGTGIDRPAPAPLERLDIERLEFRPGEIIAHVLNSGPEPVTITQVQVGWMNRANWEFFVEPSSTIARLDKALVHIPYPWISGEPYEVALVTGNSLIFAEKVDAAALTPQMDAKNIGRFALLGIYVGVIPVFLGIGWLPFLRALPQRWYFFLLSLTLGLLVFLGVDSLHEAFEVADRVPGPFQGTAIILIAFVMSLLALYAASDLLARNKKDAAIDRRILLAYSIALGIGLHNFGEGLAIGAAYALGAVAVGAMLVIGFAVHNLTEGLAVIAPIVRGEFKRINLLWLGIVAGIPTIAGAILGGYAYSPVWAVMFLAIGAGAIFQVVIEIARYQVREEGALTFASGYNMAGLAAGFAIMYVTGLFVTG